MKELIETTFVRWATVFALLIISVSFVLNGLELYFGEDSLPQTIPGDWGGQFLIRIIFLPLIYLVTAVGVSLRCSWSRAVAIGLLFAVLVINFIVPVLMKLMWSGDLRFAIEGYGIGLFLYTFVHILLAIMLIRKKSKLHFSRNASKEILVSYRKT